ncbi:MAG TPA: glycosyltransferase, partial [Candidatus Dormibacteraeota bacterium]|nr:glycosyltransferase [Candidatus Dormibacteraeota bacterium]
MRLLITVPWGERLGGAEATLQMILDGAQAAGHDVHLVFLAGGPWPQELSAAGFTVTVLDAGRLRQVQRFARTVARLVKLLRAEEPDLVINWSAKTQLYGGLAGMIARRSDRNLWWQQGVPEHHPLDIAATLLPARAVCCYSNAAARAQRRLLPRRRTLVMGSGSPPPASRRSAGLELPPGIPVVGLVGRLQPWKGQDRLLQAHAILRERGAHLHTLLVGGDSYGLSPAYAASLPEVVRRLHLEGEVTLTGEVPDAGPYIEQMDVLVNASDPEPFGIVLLEGMARGVPVVAVNSGGPGEFVEHGESGLLASSGEPQALADALQPLLRSPETRKRIGEAGSP